MSITGFRLPAAALLCATLCFAADPDAEKLWNELKEKRAALPGFRQEFEYSHSYRLPTGDQTANAHITVEFCQHTWREQWAGSNDRTRIFDGKDLVVVDEDGGEFERVKYNSKLGDPLPGVYDFGEIDWTKSAEVERRSCGLSSNHLCVLFDLRLKPRNSTSGGETAQMTSGAAKAMVDLETGIIVNQSSAQAIEIRKKSYESDTSYFLKRVNWDAPREPLRLPGGMREVKALSHWNAQRVKKQLAGKPAPVFDVVDVRGKHVSLEDFKGKTVLLDFWATWCPPCRADAPALDKLYQKYGGKELEIVGFTDENRAVVEKFLKAHPHDFSTVLTGENEVPRTYEVGILPTYIVIQKDGTVSSAVDGDKGFGELRKLLQKAGLAIE